MAVGPQESVIAPRFSRVITLLVLAIGILTEVSLVTYGHVEVLLRATPAVLLVAFGVYTLFWKPLLRVSATELVVVNPLRTAHLGWAAITEISTQWTLTVETATARVKVWAAPAQSPWETFGRPRRDPGGRIATNSAPTSRANTPAASPSQLVLRQWETYRSAGGSAEASITWSASTIVVLGTLVALTLAGILWP